MNSTYEMVYLTYSPWAQITLDDTKIPLEIMYEDYYRLIDFQPYMERAKTLILF